MKGETVKYTSIELKADMEKLNISTQQLSDLLGVAFTTAYRWLTGSSKIPRYVELVVNSLLTKKAIKLPKDKK